jgi:hypothetical protein
MSFHISLRRKSASEAISHPPHYQTAHIPETILRQDSRQSAVRSADSHRESGTDASQSNVSASEVTPRGHEFHQLRIYADRDVSSGVHPISAAPRPVIEPHITPAQTIAIARQIAPVKTGSVAPMIQRTPPPGTANTIANGHAYHKHVQVQKEFPEIKDSNDFATLINTIMTSPAEHKVLTNGREAFWDGKTVVIYNPKAGDKGTCFRPTAGKSYFDNLV